MMTNPERNDPLHDVNLAQFEPPKLAPTQVRAVAEGMGFPSRSAMVETARMPRRYNFTGRNVQLNIRVTHECWKRFVAVADDHRFAFGELLELGLDAFLEKRAAGR